MLTDPQILYQASCTAFNQGNFAKARLLASQCLLAAPKDSYIHYSALGIMCWSANYLGDNQTVEHEATRLLTGKCSSDKHWFEALALFNLGLLRQRTRCMTQAKACFNQAYTRYAAYQKERDQPRTCILTNHFSQHSLIGQPPVN